MKQFFNIANSIIIHDYKSTIECNIIKYLCLEMAILKDYQKSLSTLVKLF